MAVMEKKKILIIGISAAITSLVLALVIPIGININKTMKLETNYSYLKNDPEYSTKAQVEEVDLVTQHISCGYATIEMMSSFYGNKVTEDDLDTKNNGKLSTSSSKGFLKEINDSIPSKTFEMHSYLGHDELLKQIHTSLKNNNPVAIEWAAKYEEEWTLHFSLITGLDIKNHTVEVYNPYGYIENIMLEDLLYRATFNAYSNMPLFLQLGFAFGALKKNTIFYAN